jgi:hypothetical protein
MPLLRRLSRLLIGVLALAAFGSAHDDLPATEPESTKNLLSRSAHWTTAFAEEDVKVQLNVAVDPPVKGRLLWGLSSSERLSLFKGEVSADGAAMLEFSVKLPEVKPGVVHSTLLKAHLYRDGEREPVATYECPIHVYPRDPFHERRETLKRLLIKLYDPLGATAKVLTTAEFPCEKIFNVAAIGELKEGILLIGEGVSFRDDRSLAELLVQAAARGVPVLCLAPSAGEFELPKPGDRSAVVGLSFQKKSFVRHLDKRLDDLFWLNEPVVARHSLQPGGRGANLAIDIEAGNAGWSWLEMQFAQNPVDAKPTEPSKLIVMSLPIIEHWEAGPTPRFLLSRLIDYVTPIPLPVHEKAEVAP